MLDEMKKVMLEPLEKQLAEYNEYKESFDKIQDDVIFDSCEKEYAEKKKLLKKERKNISKEEFNNKKQELMKEYKKNLDSFNELLEEYNIKKAKLASFNVYDIKQKIEKISNAKTLEDLDFTIEKAKEWCYENGIEFRFDLEQM